MVPRGWGFYLSKKKVYHIKEPPNGMFRPQNVSFDVSRPKCCVDQKLALLKNNPKTSKPSG